MHSSVSSPFRQTMTEQARRGQNSFFIFDSSTNDGKSDCVKYSLPEGKGRFYGIRTEYRSQSETVMYLCIVKKKRQEWQSSSCKSIGMLKESIYNEYESPTILNAFYYSQGL